jgi:AcrR family transcriptional regulator
MSIRLDGDPRRDKILHAALAVFARYGFKRASMEDVATEAGISRPALYQSYENKAAIFAALAVALGQASCDAAEAAWPADLAFEEGLAAAGLALHGLSWQAIHTSPHGAELMATNSALVGDVVAAIDSRMQALVEARLTNRVPPALQALQARAITAALHGLKSQATSYEDLAALITQFARLIGAGLVSLTPA